MAVDAVTVAPGDLTAAIDVVGTLQPKFAADVKAEFTAIVDEVYVSEWVRVSKGTPLARLDTRDGDTGVEAARANLAQAEVAETRAQRELERAEKLKAAGLLTQQGLDDARSARDAAAATTAAARAQLELARDLPHPLGPPRPVRRGGLLPRGQPRRPGREHGRGRPCSGSSTPACSSSW